MARDLAAFVEESNRIEGIHRVTDAEINVHRWFLDLDRITVRDVERFVETVAGAGLRKREGMNVRVGRHIPEPGGQGIVVGLEEILHRVNVDPSPWAVHVAYEKLHPFMDGNGRSGRALWAWMRLGAFLRGGDWIYADEMRHAVAALGFRMPTSQWITARLTAMTAEDAPRFERREFAGIYQYKATHWAETGLSNKFPGFMTKEKAERLAEARVLWERVVAKEDGQ